MARKSRRELEDLLEAIEAIQPVEFTDRHEFTPEEEQAIGAYVEQMAEDPGEVDLQWLQDLRGEGHEESSR